MNVKVFIECRHAQCKQLFDLRFVFVCGGKVETEDAPPVRIAFFEIVGCAKQFDRADCMLCPVVDDGKADELAALIAAQDKGDTCMSPL